LNQYVYGVGVSPLAVLRVLRASTTRGNAWKSRAWMKNVKISSIIFLVSRSGVLKDAAISLMIFGYENASCAPN